MLKLICFLSFFTAEKLYSQDFILIKSKTDSIWEHKIKTRYRNFKSEFDSVHYLVAYDKKSKEVIQISESHHHDPSSLTKTWIYKYHFRQGRIILISRWNNTPLKDSKRQCAFYYFENEKLLYIDELGTSISNIPKEIAKAKNLLYRFKQQ